MGRRERKDVDYFPFYVKEGRTLFILEGKYECKGTGFFTNLFRFLSKTPDHHFQLEKESDQLYFFASVKCDCESALDMIEIMVATGKLDHDLWVQKRVLASQDFLDSIEDAYKKRSNPCITLDEIKQKYEIVDCDLPEQNGRINSRSYPSEMTSNGINSRSYPSEMTSNGINSRSYPQSKVKESIVKESIVEKKEGEKERELVMVNNDMEDETASLGDDVGNEVVATDNTPSNISPPSALFLDIVKKYPKEFKLDEEKDIKWFVSKVVENDSFRNLDLGNELEGWDTWLESQHRKKKARQTSRFPQSNFKQSFLNRLKKALEFEDERIRRSTRETRASTGRKEPGKDQYDWPVDVS